MIVAGVFMTYFAKPPPTDGRTDGRDELSDMRTERWGVSAEMDDEHTVERPSVRTDRPTDHRTESSLATEDSLMNLMK